MSSSCQLPSREGDQLLSLGNLMLSTLIYFAWKQGALARPREE